MLLTIGDKCDKTMIYPLVAISSAIENEDVHDDLRKHISERLDIYIYVPIVWCRMRLGDQLLKLIKSLAKYVVCFVFFCVLNFVIRVDFIYYLHGIVYFRHEVHNYKLICWICKTK